MVEAGGVARLSLGDDAIGLCGTAVSCRRGRLVLRIPTNGFLVLQRG
jgi:hypothetical protein